MAFDSIEIPPTRQSHWGGCRQQAQQTGLADMWPFLSSMAIKIWKTYNTSHEFIDVMFSDVGWRKHDHFWKGSHNVFAFSSPLESLSQRTDVCTHNSMCPRLCQEFVAAMRKAWYMWMFWLVLVSISCCSRTVTVGLFANIMTWWLVLNISLFLCGSTIIKYVNISRYSSIWGHFLFLTDLTQCGAFWRKWKT